jgi:outer membrane protein OmpA-like peptidoglycan-associated protein
MHYPLEQRFLCTGVVIDDEDETPVADAPVELLDTTGRVVETAVSGSDGKYAFAVQKDREYSVRVRMAGRFDGIQHLSTENIEQQQIVARDIHLVPDAGIWLRGVVRYKDRLGYVSDVKVSVVNMSSFFSEVRSTGESGDLFFRLQPNEQYEVLLEKPGYYSISVPVSTANLKQGVIDLSELDDLRLEPVELGRAIRLKYIKWEAGSDKLDPVAKTELDMLADRLQVNPLLTVEIGVHSDAQGDLAAAKKLTQKRADTIMAYLVRKGIPQDRLTAKGYGADRPVNQCGPGVPCSEAEHAENRRVEYTVTGNGPQ